MDLNGEQFTVILVAFCILLAIAWALTIWTLRGEKELLRYIFNGGWALAIVTVVLVTFTIGMLTVIDKLDGSTSASLLGAIAGYALGSFRRSDDSQS